MSLWCPRLGQTDDHPDVQQSRLSQPGLPAVHEDKSPERQAALLSYLKEFTHRLLEIIEYLLWLSK